MVDRARHNQVVADVCGCARRNFVVEGLLALLLLLPCKFQAAEIPDYQLGDTVHADIITPLQLVVIDPDQTATLKQKEASRVPVVCRYYTNANHETESALLAALSSSKSNFLERIAATFHHFPLEAQTVASDRFQRMIASVNKQYSGMPVTTNLAELWAQGESDDVLKAALVGTLQDAISHPLRPPNISADVRFGNTVKLVPLPTFDSPLTFEVAQRNGINFSRTNIVTITRARQEIQDAMSPEDHSLAKFLGTLLLTNCVPDVELTARFRAIATEPVWAADHYEPGQVIAKRGQLVDRRIKAALDQLREKLAAANLAQKLLEERRAESQVEVWKIGAASALGILLLVSILLWVRARRARAALLPVLYSAVNSTGVMPSSTAADVRARLAPHLAQLLTDRLFQKLLSQRAGMLNAQQLATAEMAELEARLEKLHAPLQERLRAYEQRIGELEKELSQKGEENRELIKLKIELIRNQLAAAKDKLEFN